MKNRPSVSAIKEIFRYNHETGELIRKSSGRVCDTIGFGGYKFTSVTLEPHKQKQLLVHRVAWAIFYGEWPDGFIDHKNGVRGDNRISNLRVVSRRENAQNISKPPQKKKTGLPLGVTRVLKKNGVFHCYQASININGKQTRIGFFESAEEAHMAYVDAKRKFHAGFVEERFSI